MSIRPCPDCAGKGKHWIPPNCRESFHTIDHPEISSTAVEMVRTVRPEYERCRLCRGTGCVACRAVEDAEAKP